MYNKRDMSLDISNIRIVKVIVHFHCTLIFAFYFMFSSRCCGREYVPGSKSVISSRFQIAMIDHFDIRG